MSEPVISDVYWRKEELALRCQSHAQAAWDAACNHFTPPSLVPQLKERHARFTLLADEARKEAQRERGW